VPPSHVKPALKISLWLVFSILALPIAGSSVNRSSQDSPSNRSKEPGADSAAEKGVFLPDGFDGWRVMPIRSEQEFQARKIGGEAEQHCQGIARCRSYPDFIYLAHDTGQVWRSVDGGDTWGKTLNKGLYTFAAQSIEVDPLDPSSVFVIVYRNWDGFNAAYDGLYHSSDGGENWEFRLYVPTSNSRQYEHNIAYDPTTLSATGAARWYAGFSGDQLYRSEDFGATWEAVADLSGTTVVHNIQTHPTDGLTLYLATTDGLLTSASQGENLAPLGDLPAGEISSVAIDPEDPNRIYAVLRTQGLYRSTNGGQNFSLLRTFNAVHVFLNPGHPDVLYLVGLGQQTAADDNTVVSLDAGATWTHLDLTPAQGLWREGRTRMGGRLTGIVPNPNDRLEAVAFSLATLWKTNNAVDFADSSTLFTGYNCGRWNGGVVFDRNDRNRFATFNADTGMMVTETHADFFHRRGVPIPWRQDGTIRWTSMGGADFQPGTETIVAAVGDVFSRKLVRTEDSGQNWEVVEHDERNHYFIAFHPTDTTTVFADNKRSFDGGQTWEDIPYLTARDASILGMCRSQPDTLYAVTRPRRGDVILRSDDRGDNWSVYGSTTWYLTGHDSKPIFTIDPVNPDKVYTIDSSKDLVIYDGSTWTSTGLLDLAGDSNPRNFIKSIIVDPNRPEIVYAGMHAHGVENVWRSRDGGSSWENISYNLPRAHVAGLSLSPHTGELLKGGPDGTYVFPPPYESHGLLYDRIKVIQNQFTQTQSVEHWNLMED